MKTKTILSSLVITSILFISCKKEVNTTETTAPPITTDAIAASLTNNSANLPATQQSKLINAAPNSTNPNTIMSNNPSGASGAVNPAHGQPGHRCDISVGAPLSAPAGQAASPQTAVQAGNPAAKTISTVVNTTSKPAAVAKGMNPAHGKAGHRCDIPVGSPLNTPAPKTTTAQPAAASGTVSTPINLNPDNIGTTNTTVETAPGMNPPHGQTGHRCDISVGAALPKS